MREHDSSDRHPVAVVLGAAVWRGGVPSPTLRRRAEHALRLWEAGRVSAIIATGGVGRYPPSEASVIGALLREAGVPDAAIHLEDRSTRTAENIGFALPLLEALGDPPILIVSDLWHQPRALLIARQFGLEARAAPLPLRGSRPWPFIKATLREVPGFFWTALTGWGRRMR